MKTIASIHLYLTNLKPISYILHITIISIALTIPIGITLHLLGISEDAVGGIDPNKYHPIVLIIMVVVLAPIIETFIGQHLPIVIIQSLTKKHGNLIAFIISTLLFASLHAGYSIWYAVLILPIAAALAYTYIVFQNKKESSYIITSIVHALRNLIGVPFLFFEL